MFPCNFDRETCKTALVGLKIQEDCHQKVENIRNSYVDCLLVHLLSFMQMSGIFFLLGFCSSGILSDLTFASQFFPF